MSNAVSGALLDGVPGWVVNLLLIILGGALLVAYLANRRGGGSDQ